MRILFHSRFRRSVAVPLVLLLMISGCSRGKRDVTGDVYGKITLEGQPVTTGSISYVSKDGKVAAGLLDSNGAYAIKNVVVGKYQVLVLPPPLPHPGMPGSTKKKGMADFPDHPTRYRAETTTDLEVDVAKGKHEHNFDMKREVLAKNKKR